MSDEKDPYFGTEREFLAAADESAREEAAAPNYDADMALDAEAIAARLMADIPKPTLESIRAQLARVDGGFETMLTDIAEVREKTRETGAARALIHLLHTGKTDMLRAYALESFYPATAQLTDEELCEYTALHCQGNSHVTAAVGMYVGALLTRNGLTLDEVCEVASDPVFQSYVIAMRATKTTTNRLALDVIQDLATTAANARRKTGN